MFPFSNHFQSVLDVRISSREQALHSCTKNAGQTNRTNRTLANTDQARTSRLLRRTIRPKRKTTYEDHEVALR